MPEEEGGIPWIATNTDWTIPQARGIAPGNGTLVSAVHTAVGRLATVAGKPEVPIFEEAVARFGARHPLFLGDRLDTDILGANRAGIAVRSRAHRHRPARSTCSPRPRARSRPTSSATCASCTSRIPRSQVARRRRDACAARACGSTGPDVRILAEGDRPVDLLRAGAAAIWDDGPRDLRLPRAGAAVRGSVPSARDARRASAVAAPYPGAWTRPRRRRGTRRPALAARGDRGAAARDARRRLRRAARHARAPPRGRARRRRRAPMTARLDAALAARGLARSRTHAATLIADGLVTVDGRPVVKASTQVADDAVLEVAGADHYVSRAAHKLIAGLDAFGVDVAGALALDMGASTGGFTQVLRERGAEPRDRRGCRARPARGIRRRRPRRDRDRGLQRPLHDPGVARRARAASPRAVGRHRRSLVHLAVARAAGRARRSRRPTPTSCCSSSRSSRWAARRSRADW